MQALGLGRAQLYRVYLYETAVLVFVAGFLGGFIGYGMSWLIGAFKVKLFGVRCTLTPWSQLRNSSCCKSSPCSSSCR